MVKFRNQTLSDRIFDLAIYLIIVIAFLAVAYPLYFVIIASISDPDYLNGGYVWFYPRGLNFDGYKMIIKDHRIWTGYKNTIIYSIGYTLFSVSLSLTAGYSLSKMYLFGRRAINMFFVFTMYFSGGLIPFYILVLNLGLSNKFYTLWILGALSVYHIILARTFFRTSIPEELCESASMDGCNQSQIFFRVVLPLSKPIIAVLALYSFVNQWNSYFTALIFLSSKKLYPLQLILREILIVAQELQDSTMDISDMSDLVRRQKLADLIRYGIIFISAAPLLIIYPFLQKYFVKGVLIGSVKG